MGKYYFFAVLLYGLTFSLKLQATDFSGGKGTEAEPYLIKVAKDLEDMAEAITQENQFADTYFQLVNDIALEGTQFAIGNKSKPFKGSFDGNNKTISGLIIFPQGTNGAGLFGATDLGATIKNLTITSSRLVTVGDEQSYYIGGICGYNKGNISNCVVKDVIIQGYRAIGGIAGYNSGGNIENCSFSGKASGGWWIGGIVGTMDKDYKVGSCGNVTNCYNNGEAFGIKHVGGIVGAFNNNGTVILCYNTGNVSISGGSEMGYDYESGAAVGGIIGYANNASVEKCVNLGKVESINSASSPNVGGIIGQVYATTIKNCYNTMTCSGINYANVGGIAGKYDGNGAKMERCYTIAYGDSDYHPSEITPVPTSSLLPSIVSCYYDTQIAYINGVTGEGLLTKNMVGDALKETFGTEDWVYEDGMYPRIKGIETLPDVILAASPIICYSNENGSVFDRINRLTNNMTIPTNNSLVWTVDNTEFLKIENNKVIILKRPTDELITGTITATLGNLRHNYAIAIIADLGGEGTEESPYQLSTVKQFNYFAEMVAIGETYQGKYIKLINNLDMQGSKSTPSIPVGTKANPFQGTFDGNKNEINNFYYKTEGATDINGLFVNVGANGIIKNLTFGKGSYIGSESANGTGGIVGSLSGTVYNCSNYATISSISSVGGIAGTTTSQSGAQIGQIYNCYNAGEIKATRGNAGGIVGGNSALNIDKCYNFGYVLVDGTGGGSITQPGGIAGYTAKPISNCINYGTVTHLFKGIKSVAGGIVGRTGGNKATPANITNCINAGSVIVTPDETQNGTAGTIAGTMTANDALISCYYDSQMCVDGAAYTGVTSQPTLNMTNGTALEDFDTAIWTFTNEQYPVLKDLADSDAAKLAAAPIYLATDNTFNTVSKNFKVGGNNETIWASDNIDIAAINGKDITITLPDKTTLCSLTATYKGNSKKVYFNVLDKTSGSGIEETSGQIAFSVYGQTLIVKNAVNASLQVFDTTGRIYKERKVANDTESIPLSSAGLYIVKVIKGNISHTTKIVIK